MRKLRRAPQLFLNLISYHNIFNGCSLINYVKILTDVEKWYDDIWDRNITTGLAANGTIVLKKNANVRAATISNINLIPSGWTVEYEEVS